MKKLGFLVAIGLGAMMAGCGGGSSTPAAPVVTPTPTASPTPVPTASPSPGPLSVAYTTTFGASSAATAAPAPIAFLAPTQTAILTVSESNYTGSFAAVPSCAQVTVSPATSATGSFTVTAADATATGCKVTVSGSTLATPVPVAATVPKPSGVALRWYLPNYLTQTPPAPQSASPINLVGIGSTYASILAISENNYVGGFPTSNVVTAAGCTGFATVAADATTPTGLPTPAPGQSLTYYTVTGVAAVSTAGGCSVTATDAYVPLSGPTNAPATINVEITTTSGVFQ